MDQIREFVDQRQKSWCVHCGGVLARLETDRDHVPSKTLLLKPYPANLPVVEVCKSCNHGFSHDEEYMSAFLGSVLTGSTDPKVQVNRRAASIFRGSAALRERIERGKREYQTVGGETRCLWTPEWERIERVIVKNARGHAFFEYGEPMLTEPTHVRAVPLQCLTIEQRADFENIESGAAWPEVGSRMMTRMLTGQDLSEAWVIVQDGVYRYAVAQAGTMLVRCVLFEYLAAEVSWTQ
jgi:hypothetical protein